MKYPPVKHKLPVLYQEIIKLDNAKTEAVSTSEVIPLKLYREFKQRRMELTRAAENAIKASRKK